MRRTTLLATLLLTASFLTPAAAQSWDVRAGGDWCDEGDGHRHCEVRATTVPALSGALRVLPGQNGGIRVVGENRGDVLVEAKVQVWERGRRDGRDVASHVRIHADGGEIRAEGPDADDTGWSVSFRIRVPRASDLELETTNGGISIADVNGTIRFEALNGGVRLEGLGGDVRGRTMNGGLDVELTGYAWDGAGLDVRTTNGGVKLAIPDGYNADLTTGTVNGGLRTDVPLSVHGDLSKRLRTTLGSGGPPVSVVTTNGGVRITR